MIGARAVSLLRWLRIEFTRSTLAAGVVWLICGSASLLYLSTSDLNRWKKDCDLWLAQAEFHVETKTISQLELASSLYLSTYTESTLGIEKQGTGAREFWTYPFSAAQSTRNLRREHAFNGKLFFTESPVIAVFQRSVRFLFLFLAASFAFLILGWLILKRASNLALRELQALHRPDQISAVTEFNQLKERICSYEQERQRLQAESEIGRLHARLAHDLRAPLGSLRLLATSSHLSENERQELTQAIEERIRFIAGDVLDQRKSRMSHLAIEHLEMAIRDEAKRQGKVIQLSCDLDALQAWPDQPRAELLRHLINLSFNSLDAIAQSGEIFIQSKSRQGKTEVTLRDSGPGFPEATLERIRQGLFPRSTRASGNGLGVLGCQEWVKLRGGTFEARNRPEGAEVVLAV